MFPAYRIPIIIPKTFKYVKVASSGSRPAADASYKNLFWENLPVPDILFNLYTPPFVSKILCGSLRELYKSKKYKKKWKFPKSFWEPRRVRN